MSATEEAAAKQSDSLEPNPGMLRRRNHSLTTAQRPVGPAEELDATDAQDTLNFGRRRRRIATWVSAVVFAALLIGAAFPLIMKSSPSNSSEQSIPYLGLYERGMPLSFTGVNAFTTATGVRPNVLMYYSTWNEPFQSGFATTAAERGAVPLVQLNPYGINLAAIASGQYDDYLNQYAEAVRSYHRPVILSLGHEMNGNWYPWGYTRTPSADFIAAWRHVVTLFRGLEVRNVTWMWTVNVMETAGGIPSPSPWWPGKAYVTWVGIDGYYYNPSETFASLFGPTIAAVRELTGDPILIGETGATSAVGKPAKIADLFAGVRLYGLLGFVWFSVADYSISGRDTIAAFRRGAAAYQRSTP
jgi:mannan endo-1,4-beta-mannosidase